MTYILKSFIIAAIGATALTAQVSSVYAMGSDREPETTNLIETNTSHPATVTQKNRVSTHKKTTRSPVNAFFLAQR